jgi:hypothetical protein
MKLGELTRTVRSKNAGPLKLTLDLLFDDEEAYRRALQSPCSSPTQLRACMGDAKEASTCCRTRRVDIPQVRDLGFIIADGEGFWAEVKRVADYRIRLLAPGVPAVEVVHQHERYSLRLRIAPDAQRDVLAIECRLDSDPQLRVYALLAPHLGATGYGNPAAVVLYLLLIAVRALVLGFQGSRQPP